MRLSFLTPGCDGKKKTDSGMYIVASEGKGMEGFFACHESKEGTEKDLVKWEKYLDSETHFQLLLYVS